MYLSATRPCIRGVVLAVVFSVCTLASEAQTLLQLTDINSGASVRYPSYLTAYDGMLYFRGATGASNTDVELWRSNGVYAERVADIVPGVGGGSSPAYLVSYDGRLYFQATGVTGGSKLWQYDAINGAAPATGSPANMQNPEELTVYNGSLYFRAAQFNSPNVGIELWKSNGTAQTCTDLYPGSGSSYPQHFIQYAGQLYFNACGQAGQGSELWRTDGTGAPTNAATIYPNNGSSPENFTIFNNQLFFSAYDGVHGRELWKFNAATDKATLVADMAVGGQYASSNPNNLCVYNNKLYFSANDGTAGYELWSYDGVNPPAMVAEINPTPDPGNGDTFLMDSSPASLTVFDGILYFTATDGIHGRELWAWDGSTAWMAMDINAGQYGSEPSELTVFGNQLYFSADAGYVPGVTDLQPQAFAFVPEPAALSLLAAVGWFLARRTRRSSGR